MSNIKLGIVVAIVAIIALVVGVFLGASFGTKSSLGGSIHNTQEKFVEGLIVGTSDQFSISNAGAITSSGALTLSGVLSNTTYTSTLGCQKVYQYGATTVASTTYYLYASSTTGTAPNGGYMLYATSSKPAFCN